MERMIDECFKLYTKDTGLNQDGIDELTKKDYLQDYDADDIADFFGEKVIEMIDAIEEQMAIPAQIGDDECLTVNIPLSR